MLTPEVGPGVPDLEETYELMPEEFIADPSVVTTAEPLAHGSSPGRRTILSSESSAEGRDASPQRALLECRPYAGSPYWVVEFMVTKYPQYGHPGDGGGGTGSSSSAATSSRKS